MLCKYPVCTRPRKSRGLCNTHYQRFRLGTLDLSVVDLEPRKRGGDPFERMQRFIQPTGCCWYWTGSLDGKGYGRISVGNRLVRAHRWVYTVLVGAIPDGLMLDHLCRNKVCVNPDHLEPVTNRENLLRGRGVVLHPVTTHCKHGHAYTPDNTRINRKGRKVCRRCESNRRRPR
jgi:hypothetical protein